MELEACADDGCLSMGTHIIAVARKESAQGKDNNLISLDDYDHVM